MPLLEWQESSLPEVIMLAPLPTGMLWGLMRYLFPPLSVEENLSKQMDLQ